MVLEMVAHHKSAMNDRLSDKSHPVSQTPHHNSVNMPSVAQYENVVEDPAERTQHQSQANKVISKEVRAVHRVVLHSQGWKFFKFFKFKIRNLSILFKKKKL